jgi:uncharacterized protein YndB with AHSA1/START domain
MVERQLIERVWQAPIETIWELWTTPEGIASWFGPRGFEVEVESIDLREGGAFNYTMRAVDPNAIEAMEKQGQPVSHAVESTITEIDPPRKLVYDSPFGLETMTTTVEFTEGPDGVRMTLEIAATKAGMTGGAAMGWQSSLDRLSEQLP